jgi:predicted nucleotidyltransferase
MEPDSQVIDRLVEHIVEQVQPLRIILFGSAARGEMGPDSDLDVLVVVPEARHNRRMISRLYSGAALDVGVDYVVTTPAILERYGNTLGFVYREALKDGREIYAAGRGAAGGRGALDGECAG